MATFLYRMPAGIPGSYDSVGGGLTVEPGLLSATVPPLEFGHAVAYESASGKYRAVTTGDTVASLGGTLVRPYPHSSWSTTNGGADAFGGGIPVNIGAHSIMKRGYMHAILRGATAAPKGGQVYVRIAAPGTNKVIGGLEAAADSTNTIAPPGWLFMGPADTATLPNVKVAINI